MANIVKVKEELDEYVEGIWKMMGTIVAQATPSIPDMGNEEVLRLSDTIKLCDTAIRLTRGVCKLECEIAENTEKILKQMDQMSNNMEVVNEKLNALMLKKA